ncbi:MAG: DUF484 family protein [Gammaproteobacteria bacterium]
MSIQRKPAAAPAELISDSQVANYLKDQPEFFERHTDLLAHLSLPHDTGGTAVSLVERQAAIMRERNDKLERKLRELIKVARTNQELSDKTHTLSVELMRTDTIHQALQVIEASLREDFGSERAALVLFMNNDASPDIVSNNFMRRIAHNDPSLNAFSTFLDGAKPRCGQIRDAQREFLFGPDNIEVGSAALLPLGTKPCLGMLAIGNQNAQHFHPAMSTDFLVRLSQSVTAALHRFKHQLS